MKALYSALVLLLLLAVVNCQTSNSSCNLDNIVILASADIEIDKDSYTFYRYHQHVLSYMFVSNITINGTVDENPCVRAVVDLDVDERRCKGVVQFLDGDPFYRRFELNLENTTYNVSVNAVQLGSCLVDANITGEDSNGQVEIITERDVLVKVIRERSPLDAVFQLLMMTLIIFGNIAMGLKTDAKVVIETLKRPVGPVVALAIQFIIQPLAAYALINIFSIYPETVAFGFFIVGCSPSGTASNFHTYLLGGDVSLAVTVTLCSTLLSLAMYPLWIYTIGKVIMSSSPSSLEIPFTDIVLTLAEVVVPVIIGGILKLVKPTWAAFLLKWIVQPYLSLVIIYLLTAGIYTNIYLFEVVSWQVLLCGCLLPYFGFLIGYIVAALLKQTKERKIAVMIESGLQNVYIPIFMLRQTFDQPDADLSSVGPLGALLLGPIPLYAAEIAILLRNTYHKSEKFRKVADKICCCCLFWYRSGQTHKPLPSEPTLKVLEEEEREATFHRSVNASTTGLSGLDSKSAEPAARSRAESQKAISRKSSTVDPERQPLIAK